MSMLARPDPGSRLVMLATVAATLLSAWMPPARACACEPAAGTVRPVTPEPAAACPCCGHRPADDALPACCQSHEADESADSTACGCGPLARPGSPEPTAPPRPADSDDSNVSPAADAFPTADHARPPAGPSAAEVAVHLADPPPTDLVISLSRLTC